MWKRQEIKEHIKFNADSFCFHTRRENVSNESEHIHKMRTKFSSPSFVQRDILSGIASAATAIDAAGVVAAVARNLANVHMFFVVAITIHLSLLPAMNREIDELNIARSHRFLSFIPSI